MSKCLKSRELCPIHRSYFCEPCHKPSKLQSRGGAKGRKSAFHASSIQPPRFSPKPAVLQVEDSTLARGYREVINDRERQRRKSSLISQNRYNGTLLCGYSETAESPDHILSGYCGKSFTDYTEIELCHKLPKGMGGATHDDHWENLFLGCRDCNRANGSRRAA